MVVEAAEVAAGPILELRHIEKHFSGVSALSDGNFELANNEVHAIVGDNGAGKSTLLKVIAGAHQPDGGEYLIDGEHVQIPLPTAAAQYGIATVFQDLALIDHLDASANLFLGREVLRRAPLRWLGVLDKPAMRARAIEAVRQLKVGVNSVDQPLMGMSGGQRQAVAVARAVLFGTRVVVMDEPTAALGVRETGAVLEMIRRLKANGLSVVMISHNLPDVFAVADRITILRLGRTVRTVRCDETDLEEIVGMMTGAWSDRV
jgi:simple sugar transport system ATP-binding protein